jgi:hypothetical protein
MQAANVDVKSITIEYSAADRSVKVTVTTDFDVLSAGVLDPFMGTIELVGTTVMRYEG